MGILRSDLISHSQLEPPGGSVLFNGGDGNAGTAGLRTADNDESYKIQHDMSQITIECWIYCNSLKTLDTIWATNNYGVSGNAAIVYRQHDGIYMSCSGFPSDIFVGGLFEYNRWYHVATVRDYSYTRSIHQWRIYVDGVNVAYGETNQTITEDQLCIGASNYAGAFPAWGFDGYISNFRMCRRALYKEDFTPPKFKLKNIPGTVLLCCQDASDDTTAAVGSITAGGSPTPGGFAPDLKEDITDIGPVFADNTKFDTLSYMVPPGGTTTQRGRGRGLQMGSNLTPGASSNAITYIEIATTGNTKDFGDLIAANATGGAVASSTRAVYGGGWNTPGQDIEYVTIATQGNAVDFGANRTGSGKGQYAPGSGNSTRGLFWSSMQHPNYYNNIDFVTIATTGACTEFGEINKANGRYGGATFADSTRAVYAGGVTGATPNALDEIDRVQIATQSDGTDFGDLTTAKRYTSGASNTTRGIVYSGGAPAASTIIEYITIQGGGGSTDFGDATVGRSHIAGMSNSIRGVFAGGYGPTYLNVMESITIASIGNAVDWGDYVVGTKAGTYSSGTSDSHGGIS